MAEIRRLAGQYSWIIGGRVVGSILQAILFVIIARAAEPRDFGVIMAVVGIGVVLQAAFGLGMSTLILRERANAERPGIIPTALRINAMSSALLAVIASSSAVVIGTLLHSETIIALAPVGVGLALERVGDTRLSIAIADGRMSLATMNLLARRVIGLGVFLIPLAAGASAALAFGLSSLGSGLVAVLLTSRVIRVGRDARKIHFRQTLRAGVPYYVNTLSSQVRNLDVFLITALAGPIHAGLYAAASRVIGPFQLLVTSAATVILPTAARQQENRRRSTARAIGATSIAAAVPYLAISATTSRWVPLLLGPEYVDAVLPVSIIVLALIPTSLTELAKPTLQGWGYASSTGLISAVSAIVLVVLIAIGAMFAGAVGAAISFAIAVTIQGFAMGVLLHRKSER